jgi:hypothetical protein
MTILSKALSEVKTLIEYAKCGMGLDKIYRVNVDNPADLYFPKPIEITGSINNAPRINMKNNLYIRSIKGKITKIKGEQSAFSNMLNLEVIDLPECIEFYAPYGCAGCVKLHTVKLPKLSIFDALAIFDGCVGLKYLELGTLTTMGDRTLLRCTELETIVIGKDTSCNLYFRYCRLLTQKCMHNIIDNVKDLAAIGAKACTISVNLEVYNRISEEYKTKLSNKGWNLAVENQ